MRHSFIVRVWQEEGQSGWRGWVQHVHSGESAVVRDLDDLVAFLAKWTGNWTESARKSLR